MHRPHEKSQDPNPVDSDASLQKEVTGDNKAVKESCSRPVLVGWGGWVMKQEPPLLLHSHCTCWCLEFLVLSKQSAVRCGKRQKIPLPKPQGSAAGARRCPKGTPPPRFGDADHHECAETVGFPLHVRKPPPQNVYPGV
uniref:Uncharacterized protein n=1 Tax=Eutreptiella gymnastica TaxID=73025 RepID=A0A7S4CWZ1_9EUGL